MNKDIFLTNNLSNKKEKFVPINEKKIVKERRCIQVNYVTFQTDWKVE